MYEIVVTQFVGTDGPITDSIFPKVELVTIQAVICKRWRSFGPFALTDSTLARIERLATHKGTNHYDGEPGHGYALQTTYRFDRA